MRSWSLSVVIIHSFSKRLQIYPIYSEYNVNTEGNTYRRLYPSVYLMVLIYTRLPPTNTLYTKTHM